MTIYSWVTLHCLNSEEIIAAVKNQTYGSTRGRNRHIINQLLIKKLPDRDDAIGVVALCGLSLIWVHNVTRDPRSIKAKATDLSAAKTCTRCLKHAGLPLEPVLVKCPTCAGKGKIRESVEVQPE